MARTVLTPLVLVRYPALALVADSQDVPAFATGTATDGFEVAASGREVILVTNVNVATQTVTIKSVADGLGRVGDLGPYVIAQNQIAAFIPPLQGFVQSTGVVNIDVGHNDVHVAVIRLPAMI